MAGMVRTAIVIRRISALSESLDNGKPFSDEHRDALHEALEILVRVHNERKDDA